MAIEFYCYLVALVTRRYEQINCALVLHRGSVSLFFFIHSAALANISVNLLFSMGL